MRLRFGSVCSGIEAASVAWNPLGWEAAWFSEIEPFPSALLAHHFPTVPNLGDMTTLPERIRAGEVEAPDVLCGGTPCQAFSVAGKRHSLGDERGSLSLTFCNVADSIDAIRRDRGLQPCIVFWENVPGVLSTKDNAFGCFLAELVGSDFPLSTPSGRWPSAGMASGPKRKAAWRVLDAKHFGVPQRRRRVFLVGRGLEEGLAFDPAKVLFEPKGLPRADEAGERPREDLAAYAEGSFGAYREVSAAGPVRTAGGTYGGGSENLLLCYDMTHANDVIRSAPTAPTLLSRMGTAVWNGQAYVVGGVDEQVSDAFQIYNAAGNLWTEYPALSERRSEPVCFVYRDSLYVVGGSNSKGILRYDLSAESSGTWQTVADFPENQVGGVAFVVGENEVYAGLGRNNDNNMRTDFYYATDSLTHWEPIPNTPESLESISSGVYDSEGNRFWMVDSSGKIWEYSLSDATWRARSLVPTRMKNYHMFQLDGIIYILGQDVWSKNKFFIYNPIWDN